MAEVAGREVHRGTVGLGSTSLALPVPEGAPSPVAVTVTVGGQPVLREEVTLAPVAPRTFFLVPHSHVDIGYSDPQPEVERKQWRNLKDAIALADTTRALPPEARFHWQAEGLWAVETYLAQASEDERRALAEAVARGDVELPMNLTNVLTGLCHPEELARWTDAARRLKSRYGIEASPVAMHTDIPGLAWPTVDGARAGRRPLLLERPELHAEPRPRPRRPHRLDAERERRPAVLVGLAVRPRAPAVLDGRPRLLVVPRRERRPDRRRRGPQHPRLRARARASPATRTRWCRCATRSAATTGPVDPNLPRARRRVERGLRHAEARDHLGAGALRGAGAAVRLELCRRSAAT